jgi:hypothetical protein
MPFRNCDCSQETAGITSELYQQLIQMLESGKLIRNIPRFMKVRPSHTGTIYSKGFYRFFRLAGIITINYICCCSGFEIGLNNWSVFMLILYPFIVIGNAIGNRGKLFTHKNVGRTSCISILKFRSMRNNCESNGAVFATTVIYA